MIQSRFYVSLANPMPSYFNGVRFKSKSKRNRPAVQRQEPAASQTESAGAGGGRSFRYEDLHAFRRKQAARSLLIVSSQNAESLVGKIQGTVGAQALAAFRMAPSTSKQQLSSKSQTVLLEFPSTRHVDLLLDRVSESAGGKPCCRRLHLSELSKLLSTSRTSMPSPPVQKCLAPLSSEALLKELQEATSVENQFQRLIDLTCLDEAGIRARFFIPALLEDSLSKAFSGGITCRPFGSTANGFGRAGCDLDMELSIDTADDEIYADSLNSQMKRKDVLLRVAEQIAKYKLLTDIRSIQRILSARVPIVKFEHASTGVKCDLAYHRTERSNRSGYNMSKLFWLYSEMHPCVVPLVFAVRQWAVAANLTSEFPGPWITNFHLVHFVLHFLIAKGILPLAKEVIADYGIGITQSPRNAKDPYNAAENPMEERKRNDAPDLRSLLLEFFHYYANKVDFALSSLSLDSTAPLGERHEGTAMAFWNPFDAGHNMTKNVNAENRKHFLTVARIALRAFDRAPDGPGADSQWGLGSILATRCAPLLQDKGANITRSFNVSSIFQNDKKKSDNSPSRKNGAGENGLSRKDKTDDISAAGKMSASETGKDEAKELLKSLERNVAEANRKRQFVDVDSIFENDQNTRNGDNSSRKIASNRSELGAIKKLFSSTENGAVNSKQERRLLRDFQTDSESVFC